MKILNTFMLIIACSFSNLLWADLTGGGGGGESGGLGGGHANARLVSPGEKRGGGGRDIASMFDVSIKDVSVLYVKNGKEIYPEDVRKIEFFNSKEDMLLKDLKKLDLYSGETYKLEDLSSIEF
ncbi:MAG: hypothetical protein HQK52_22240 [Oligoflexia bacterium]|nr:hypothetical protein [Oligoflexia bacterium]